MSRCRQTDALLDATFAGTGFTRAEADHAAGCSECAHALAQARRFDRELQAVGADLVPEPIRPGEAPAEVTAPIRRGGLTMWRRVAAVAGGAVVLAVAIYGGGAVVGSLLSGPLHVGGIGAAELGAWLDRAVVVAHDESERGSSSVADWEPAQIETCGQSVVVFFERNQARGYLWAIGRPGDIIDPSIGTGSSATLDDPDVARRRAVLPICEVALGDLEPLAERVDLPPIPPQRVVTVPEFWWRWEGQLDEELNRPSFGVVRGGVRRDAYVYGHLDDLSVRVVDLVTPVGRLRYPVGLPGFVIQGDLAAEAFRFDLLDGSGLVIASGPVVEWEAGDVLDRLREDARREVVVRARAAAALAAAEREALEAGVGGAECAAWWTMTDQEQMVITEVLVSDLERVRIRQQLPAGASVAEIIAGARASLDKGCQGSPADRAVADIARALYGDD